ncbi:hypothetical protein CCH79_00008466 [Gambusia affinis]|uniref:Uncharacterized protein n=1 Tax=Gambusia affinis TaxID=33528 RepID=A0A315UUK3_GAMAF|nr:hypothetical protein CCH79_00008466 [Gambusia affinis]
MVAEESCMRDVVVFCSMGGEAVQSSEEGSRSGWVSPPINCILQLDIWTGSINTVFLSLIRFVEKVVSGSLQLLQSDHLLFRCFSSRSSLCPADKRQLLSLPSLQHETVIETYLCVEDMRCAGSWWIVWSLLVLREAADAGTIADTSLSPGLSTEMGQSEKALSQGQHRCVEPSERDGQKNRTADI